MTPGISSDPELAKSIYYPFFHIEIIENILFITAVPITLIMIALVLHVIRLFNNYTLSVNAFFAAIAVCFFQIFMSLYISERLQKYYTIQTKIVEGELHEKASAIVRDALGSDTAFKHFVEDKYSGKFTHPEDILNIYRFWHDENDDPLKELSEQYRTRHGIPLFPYESNVRDVVSSQVYGPRGILWPSSAYILVDGPFHVETVNEFPMYRTDQSIKRDIETYINNYNKLSPKEQKLSAQKLANKISGSPN